MPSWRSHIKTAAAALALATTTLTPAAHGQAAYPDRDIHFVVQGSAGGGSDLFARAIVDVIQKGQFVKQSVVIDNRPGGGGAVAYNFVAQRKGNPYYLGTIGGSFFTTPLLGQSPVNYQDFTPIAALAEDPYVLLVRKGAGLESFDAIKQRGTLRVGTTGAVTDPGLLAKMLEGALGIKTRAIPFGGDGEVLAALLGDHIDLQFGNPGEVSAQIRAGSLEPLAVSSGQRLADLPEVPTFVELGMDVELTQLRGVVMPKGVSPTVIAYWEGVLRQVSDSAQWKEYLAKNSAVPVFLDSKTFGERMPAASNRYATFMKEVGALKQ